MHLLFQEPYTYVLSTLGSRNSECKKHEERSVLGVFQEYQVGWWGWRRVNETDDSKREGQRDGVSESKHVPGRGVLYMFRDVSHIST